MITKYALSTNFCMRVIVYILSFIYKQYSDNIWHKPLYRSDIRTLHDCPSQMNENLLISNSKLTSDSELIWWRLSTNLSSFVRDSHVWCVLYNGKDNHYQIHSWIQIMRNVRVLNNHERPLLAHPCTFGEKIARFGISQFLVIIVLHQSQMIIDKVEFTSYESFPSF